MKVVIFAGGFGTRIGEESVFKPKPMIEIGGKPILWHIMKYYYSFGYNDFIILGGYKQEIIKQYFEDYFLANSDITFNYIDGNMFEVHQNHCEKWNVTVKEENIKELQRIWFKKQIELASELKLPIVIHTRDAVQDTYDILKDSSFKYPIILHCYNNSLEMTKLYLKMENVYFSFGGVLTFKNASNLREIIKVIPLNRILIETDAPYLSPVPYRGKLNLPEYIFLTLKEMSNILNINEISLNNILTNNAKKVLNIDE